MRTRGEGGLNMTKNTHFVHRFIENDTISETFKDRWGVLVPAEYTYILLITLAFVLLQMYRV